MLEIGKYLPFSLDVNVAKMINFTRKYNVGSLVSEIKWQSLSGFDREAAAMLCSKRFYVTCFVVSWEFAKISVEKEV